MEQINEMYNGVKTPYYVIHKKELDDNLKKLADTLEKHWNNYIIGYSYKTNALPWIIKHFDSLGCYAETVSEDEYNLAKLVGIEKDKIIYNGPIKTKETFIEALQNNCIVNIDSQREIYWLDEIRGASNCWDSYQFRHRKNVPRTVAMPNRWWTFWLLL